MYKPARTE